MANLLKTEWVHAVQEVFGAVSEAVIFAILLGFIVLWHIIVWIMLITVTTIVRIRGRVFCWAHVVLVHIFRVVLIIFLVIAAPLRIARLFLLAAVILLII